MSDVRRFPKQNKWKFWKTNHEALTWLMVILLIVGSLNVFSSTFIIAERNFNTPYYFIIRHGFSLAIGAVVFLVASVVDYHKWRRFMVIITPVILLLLVLVLAFSEERLGARRWISLAGFSFQPSEPAKLCGIMLTGYYLAYCNIKQQAVKLVCPSFLAVLTLGAFVAIEPDMGTASIIIGIPVLMMIMGGLSSKYIKIAGGLLMTVATIMIVFFPFRLNRIKAFLDPWAYEQSYGYQTVSSLIAIGSGGFSGMGIGSGLSKYQYLPEAHTDFAIAVLSQEMGFLVVTAVLLVYMMLIYYMSRVVKVANDMYGQFLAIGVMFLICGQAIGNLFMVTGMFPVVGVPLPFISYGGTSLMVSMFAMGLLINISRESQRRIEKEMIIKAMKETPDLVHHRPRLKRVK